ncbi:MAG: hypothetical protein R3F60_18620 [bacterium]
MILLAPLPAMVVGAQAGSGQGVPWEAWLPNLAGLAVGALLVGPLGRPRLVAWLPVLAAAGIALTLVCPAWEGVTRWLPIGSLRLHLSSILAPLLLLGLSRPGPAGPLLALIAQGAHLAQPDAAQASALALGAIPLVASRPGGLPLGAALIGMGGATWWRGDAVPAVPPVEGILGMIGAQGTPGVAAAAVAGGLLLLPFVTQRGRGRLQALAPLLYMAGAASASGAASFPVPVFGAGAGPVIGWYTLLAAASPPSAPRRKRG